MDKLNPVANEFETQAVEPQSYIVDTRPLCQGMPFVLTDVAHPRYILKHAGQFLVVDQSGAIPACNTLGYGYYRYDTRHLSQWELYINDCPLSLLSCDVEKGYAAYFLYTNPQMGDIPQQKITARRLIVLDDLLWERLDLENYSNEDIDIELQIKFYSDFADMFEVRGLNRPSRGKRMVPVASADGKRIFLAYRGLDECLLETVIEINGLKPHTISDGVANFHIRLPRRKPISLESCILTKLDGHTFQAPSLKEGLEAANRSADEKHKQWQDRGASIQTEHKLFDLALKRSYRDIYILRQPTAKGWGIAAGIPWYGTIFGRDSAIVGWQLLPYHPEFARESIEVLAAYQGQHNDEFKEEEPGKILHELRLGELARTGIIPHSPYYGTVDATPLWLMLLSEYIRWTGDLDFASNMWPRVKQALSWLDQACQAGNGYLTYQRLGPHGLENQGWKDSGDSIMHKNGQLAAPPIAVCEAQGYLYAAWLSIADLAYTLSHTSLSQRLRRQASMLKEAFIKDFWIESEKFLAIALDGDGKRAEVLSSNPGHCLWTGILDGKAAELVADRLMEKEMHTGWGIRTLSDNMVAFNPIGYHNGSVWPHDNAIIGEGMRRIGKLQHLQQILHDLVEVSQKYPGFRLPELFSGFAKLESGRPIDYPVSCSPQAWASGSFFQLLSACLNFQPDAINKVIRIVDPALPEWLGQVTIRNLRLGDAEMDLAFHNKNGSTFCQILRRQGHVRIIIENG